MSGGSKRVLLTGASGFIGRHAIEPLARLGYEVHAVSSKPQAANSSAIWHTADLLAPDAARELTAQIKPTHCLHFAWYAVHGKFWSAPENLAWVEASLRLLRELAAHGCSRVVTSGTCAEYDWSHGRCAENMTPLRPGTLYGVCKHSLRLIAEAYCAQQKMSQAWGRIFLLYGPDEAPQRLVPAVIRACLKGESARCSHGMQQRDFLHVADVAEAFAALLDSSVEGAVNIGSGAPLELREIVGKIVRLTGAPEANFGALSAPANDPLELFPNVTRLRDEVGWHPRIELEAGLRATIEAARATELGKGG